MPDPDVVIVELHHGPEGPRCDFCGCLGVSYDYGCQPFAIPELRFNSADHHFAACTICAGFIDAGDRHQLYGRALQVAGHEDSGVRLASLLKVVRLVQDGFWAHRTGLRQEVG